MKMPDRFQDLLSCPSRFPDHKLRPALAINRRDRFLFIEGFRKIEEDFEGGGAQNFHRPSNRRRSR